jgi:predicted AAA+ superfamily ATPase
MQEIHQALERSPVVTLLGPRQCGKTTLAQAIAGGRPAEYFDLEDDRDLSRLSNPYGALEALKGLVVIDEIQRKPGLFEVLRVLADRWRQRAKFLVLGSASPHVMRGASESLAGRVALVEMGGLTVDETGVQRLRILWERGGFPRSFLAASQANSAAWREDFIQTFLQRDVPQLGVTIPAHTLRRFWTMVAHYHGQVWNAAELARSLGTSEPTARRYLDLLSGAFVVRQLAPWVENLRKRQVKAPKVYVRDSGVLHSLLSLSTMNQIMSHPKYGASWEGFALEQVMNIGGYREAYFWATHGGAELDLLIMHRGQRIGFEFKATETPKLTPSMKIAFHDLNLTRLWVIHSGQQSFPMEKRILAVSIHDLSTLLLKEKRTA